MSNTFTFEPQLTCRLAQWGARIYEVPISYHGHTYEEGKKIRPIDGLKALWAMICCRFLHTQFSTHARFQLLASMSGATGYNRWILRQVERWSAANRPEPPSGPRESNAVARLRATAPVGLSAFRAGVCAVPEQSPSTPAAWNPL